jgi:hypothetical protein
MTSLTRIAIITRKAIRYSIYGIIGIIALRAVILTGIRVYRHYYPEPPPPPTVEFGKLPSLPFPERAPVNFAYTLETPEGGLPSFPSQLKVYYMPKLATQLLSLDVAREKAKSLGFSTDAQKESETIYKFSNPDAPSELKINITTGAFSISYDFSQDSSPLEARPPAPEVAAESVRSYLNSTKLLPEDLTGPTFPDYVRFSDGKLVGAISLSESNLVKINFLRKSFDDYPSLTPSTTESNVWFMVSGSRERGKKFVAAEFHHFPIDETQSATYPIKTSQAAWDELNAGNAFIVDTGSNKENVVIRRVYLAYYDPKIPTDFFQPIVVFEGDNGFVAYVPAISSEYYGE